MVEYGIGKKSIEWGNSMALSELEMGASNPKVKKKISFKEIKKQNGQSHALGCLDFAQMALALATEIEKMKDGNTGQNQFELLVGELEILYLESTNTLKNNFKLALPEPSIEHIMGARKKWSVDATN